VTVPLPAGVDVDGLARHRPTVVDAPDVVALLDAAGVRVTTMGRGPSEDELFFRAAGAAGHHAGTLAAGRT
jgi:hypothetical protein